MPNKVDEYKDRLAWWGIFQDVTAITQKKRTHWTSNAISQRIFMLKNLLRGDTSKWNEGISWMKEP